MRWTSSGVELEADPSHAEFVIRELGIEDSRPCKTPRIEAANDDGPVETPVELDCDESRRYRAIADSLNYLAPDRVDIGYAVKEAARNMAKAMSGHWDKLKRIRRDLLGQPRLVSKFDWQPLQSLGTV